MSTEDRTQAAQTWQGSSYDRVSGPMAALGRGVLERLELRGDEVVIDAGCGSGRLTEQLIERLPAGRVIALDASESMLDAARERLARPLAQGSVELAHADLLDFAPAEPVDVVFSTATFHWVLDHERLFARLHAALRPSGLLVAQCGGRGNLRGLRGRAGGLMARDPYAEHFAGWTGPWNYAGPEETRERLLAAGFQSAECWLIDAPQQPEHAREFLATIIFGPHLRRLPEELRDPFVDELMELVGDPLIVDYVRLNIDAVA